MFQRPEAQRAICQQSQKLFFKLDKSVFRYNPVGFDKDYEPLDKHVEIKFKDMNSKQR